MQGQLLKDTLRGERLNFTIRTSCAHCGKPIQIEMDDQLNYNVFDMESSPLIFSPMVDFDRLEDPSIIDAF